MTLTIERLGHRGDGIAPGPVFVPLTLPGEEVEGEVSGDRIDSPRIVTPSPDRVRPPCRHFKSCGGCALQHASDAYVETWKADIVRTALAAHGLDAPIRGVATSPPRSRRRATFSGRRTKKGALVGFHARASDTVIEGPDCQLVLPEIAALLPALTEITKAGASRRGELSLSVTRSQAGADVFVSGGHKLDGPLRATLAQIAQQSGFARLGWDGETVVEIHPPAQSFDGIETVPPPGAFLQATRHGEAALLAAVQEAVGNAKRIVDLFAGCGTFALPLARTADIHAVEAGADMLAALDRAWRHAHGLKQVTTEMRDLFRRPLLAAELDRHDAIVIDPPRAGAEAQTAEIARSAVPRIAAVSCNPATFARDAAMLAGAGYSLDWVQVVDQFRWSPHVELAAQFSR
ncbi:class I SAM-dependent RNA methyltransferase [Psychromarinibacter sp. C21-152]|uniref:Class I SAM-dependent RNA methyltransferase n=1 Tax=Psychromarinibacter sediminicola TaxID=3033385 RepID=A0AAE3T9U8_9RHOB|nr:class I SAM-dependent RNA methyltransferase [Psychromarinibacter sediminicola]MDF0601329.1 class I SAM-dependent RNA methyltransferase [Psychromarinibacter sediminicola]